MADDNDLGTPFCLGTSETRPAPNSLAPSRETTPARAGVLGGLTHMAFYTDGAIQIC